MKYRIPAWLRLLLSVSLVAAPWSAMAQCAPGQTTPYNGVWTTPPGAAGYNPNVNYCIPNFSVSPALRKFRDALPGLGATNQNQIGQYIPVATPDKLSYPGADYYEIGLKQYTQQLHSDLPAGALGTKLRGYYQKNGTDTTSRYLGPMIVAKKGTPVRLKFFNELAKSNAGVAYDYPLPVDRLLMGAGEGPLAPDGVTSCDPMTSLTPCATFTDNRSVVHLHGGLTPWISDGTPHQWITPAGEPSPYKKGASFRNVPDMALDPVATGCVAGDVVQGPSGPMFCPADGDGIGTYYYTNNQSGRLLFYHDHTLGMTRLNVYGGMAAPYLIVDTTEEDLITRGVYPSQSNLVNGIAGGVTLYTGKSLGEYRYGIPLVIQDKSFVNGDANATGATPTNGSTRPSPSTIDADPLWFTHVKNSKHGDLWMPHEYLPNEDIFNTWYDPATNQWGANPMGRWDYSPWMNPPATPMNDVLPSPTAIPETYGDTMMVNGTVFPYLDLAPVPVRFRILNASNDRFVNLQLYYASTAEGVVCKNNAVTDLSRCTEVSMVPAIDYSAFKAAGLQVSVGNGLVQSINLTHAGTGYTLPPVVTITGDGTGAAAVATISGGAVTGVRLINQGTGYTAAPTVTFTNAVGDITGSGATATSVLSTPMLLNTATYPNGTLSVPTDPTKPTEGSVWPTDGRAGGVPYWEHAGPPIYQVGNEAGMLAQVAVRPQQPIDFDHNTRSVTLNGVNTTTLLLPSAVRADAIVDFSMVPSGSALILYNDAPAPMPLWDTRNDYFTNNDDQSWGGGAPSTEPGYGPNTRTIMQFRVQGSKPANLTVNTTTSAGFLSQLQTEQKKAYFVAQKPPLVKQKEYPADASGNPYAVTNVYANIVDEQLNISGGRLPLGSIVVTAPGQGYTKAPTVKLSGGSCVNNLNRTVTPTATATLNGVTGVALVTGGAGYTTAPTVSFTPAAGGGGTGATAVAVVTGGVVTGIFVTNPGSGYLLAPTVNITGGGGAGATAQSTVVLGSLGTVSVTSTGVTCLTAPNVSFTAGKNNPGTGATAVATLTGTTPQLTSSQVLVLDGKNLVEGFDVEFGRMNAMLGSTPNPLTPAAGAGPVMGLAYYVDPPTELLTGGTTYAWRIMHIGVDSHAVHLHLFDAQLVNRVDWTGVIKAPNPDELGWKETIRTNPFEDIIIALRPGATDMQLPFALPDSVRLLDPTVPVNSTGIFTPVVPPPGIPAVAQTTNVLHNYGWEYVWHCHLLGHEENDMMRPIAFTPEIPKATLSTTSMTFAGTTAVGATSTATQTVTVTNTGAANLNITGVALDKLDYTVLTPAPAGAAAECTNTTVLAPNGSCSVNIKFTPKSVATISGTLTITSNNMGVVGGTSKIMLTGTAAQPQASIDATLNFGTLSLNSTLTKSVTLTNTGGVTMSGIAIAAPTPASFSLAATGSNMCGTTLAAGAACQIYVVFAPTAATTITNGALSVTATGVTIPPVTLLGIGAAVPLATVTSALDFGIVKKGAQSGPLTVTVTNTGAAQPLRTSVPTLSGAYANLFSVTPAAGCTLNQTASCSYAVTFNSANALAVYPTTYVASLDFTSNSNSTSLTAGPTTHSVPLTAVVNVPTISVSTPSLSFGTAVTVGSTSTLTATVTNTGAVALALDPTAPFTLTNRGTAGVMTISSNTCTASLAPAATCVVTVQYVPTAFSVTDSADLVIKSDSGSVVGTTVTRTFTAITAAPTPVGTLALTTATAFTNVARNGTATGTVTLTNTGTAALTLKSAPTVTNTTLGSTSFSLVTASTTCKVGTPVAANGGSCVISVQYKAPNAKATRNANVAVATNNNVPANLTLTLTGTTP